MSLQSEWEEVVRANEFDKLSVEDQEILRSTYFNGAVALCALLSAGEDQDGVWAELKSFVDDKRRNNTDQAALSVQEPASSDLSTGRRRIRLSTTKDR